MKYFGKDWKGRGVFMAEESKIDSYRPAVDELLGLLAKYMGWKDTSHIWVSDESSLWDFMISDDDLKDLSQRIGFKVEGGDRIWYIASRLPEPPK